MDFDKTSRAISIRQPFAEQILRGTKRIEYRSRPTKITGRVLVYASQSPGPDDEWNKMKLAPGDLPTGVLVGSVEITGCKGVGDGYGYTLANPQRIAKPVKPKNKPQPIWFYPF